MDILPHLPLQVLLILLTAVFTCAEIALVSVADSKLAQLADEGSKSAKKVRKMMKKPARYLAATRTVITFCAMICGGVTLHGLIQKGSNAVSDTEPVILRHLFQVLIGIAVALLLGFLYLLLGYLIPRRIAERAPEKVAMILYPIPVFFAALLTPVIIPASAIANAILRLFGIKPHDGAEEVTEEEIRKMVDVGTESGAIDIEEKEIIQNVFEFDDLCAGDIATHRTDITLLWMDEEPEEWEKIIRETNFSRYPICDESVDKIIGILVARDYLTLQDKSRRSILDNAVRPAYLVPENVKADLLFKNMKQKKEFFAVVLDEHGGTAGIVTMNDLVECLVGEFNTADDEEETGNNIEPIGESLWRIRGTTPLSEVSEAIGITFDDDDTDTFSGYVLGLNGNIPEDGTVFDIETDSVKIRALSIKDHMVELAELFKKPTEDDEANKDAEDENDDKDVD